MNRLDKIGRAIKAFVNVLNEDLMDNTYKDIQDNIPIADCDSEAASVEEIEGDGTEIIGDSIDECGSVENRKETVEQEASSQPTDKTTAEGVIYDLEKENPKDLADTQDVADIKNLTDTKDINTKDGVDTNDVDKQEESNVKGISAAKDKSNAEDKESGHPVEAKSKMDSPDVRLKTSLSLGEYGYVAGLSIQGRSHIQDGTECQDYHYFENLGEGWLLAIVSDGAGSAREAARGSKANCELASQMIKRLLAVKKWKETSYFPSEKEWHIEIANIFEIIQAVINKSAASQAASYKKEQEEKIEKLKADLQRSQGKEKAQITETIKKSEKNAAQILQGRDFNATLIVLLKSPKGMMTAHIGDGRMGYLSNNCEWHSLMTPHKGDEASSTVFIPSNWNRQMEIPAFMMKGAYLPDTRVVEEIPKAFVLMSDGCESFSWNCTAYDHEKRIYYDRNTPFDRFLNPLIDYLNKVSDLNQRVDDMIDIINIGTVGGKREMDDRTMLLWVSETSQS